VVSWAWVALLNRTITTVRMSCRRLGNTHRALDTSEPSCVPGAARSFFIPVVHNPLGAVGTWQHRSSPLGEARPGPRGSAGAHLGREARSEAEEHVATPEPTSTGRRGPELRNTWQRRSSTQQGGEAQGHGPRGSTRTHLMPWDTWRLQSPPLQ
jgi:hypothetical protein